ncbi:MAG: bifunctional salicylyl-CoA 5-hydroxylase/oxidoreductase [Rhodospirillales bacterium]|nr:bifunctional salicylyl-CoA 5-hydroxylase/oxidoreductase [Rhodospirillales bacterium]
MEIVSVGGGPAGLFFGILMKQRQPSCRVTVLERNRPRDTFGWGVVFSDETMGNIAAADPPSFKRITEAFAHWDDIDIHYQGEVLTSTGHGFSGLSRVKLLEILQERARELGVELRFETEVAAIESFRSADLVVGADGVNSRVRELHADAFRPEIDFRPNRFIWLGTTHRFGAFTFLFKENEHGLWRAHAYDFDRTHATFIVEATETTWRNAGLDKASEEESIAYCTRLFADNLRGTPLLGNKAIWRSFPIVRCGRWRHENIVLLGDACHTAHFSIGSGTKLAMEDAIALADALARHGRVPDALEAYESERRPVVESTQRAAQTSLQWFEETERYFGTLEPLQFAASLLTRSLRITHENLKLRDPRFVRRLDSWFASRAANQSGVNVPAEPVPPPMFTPYRLRDMVVSNRIVVSPMCMYSAEDGLPNDWHLVHLGSRAVGGAALIMTEMTDIAPDARITPGCAGLWSEAHAAAWKRVVDFVHASGPAKIGVQLAHAGRKGATKLLWEGMDEPLEEGAWPIIAPSPVPYLPHSQVPREMTRADMDRVRDDFVRAALYADKAGFDLIELHMAHGYLLASFLSPVTNRRRDEYGGILENRMRFPLEVFAAVRAVWPQPKPMSVRISGTDWIPGGFEAADAVALAKALKSLGCDIVDVSTGQTDPASQPRYGRLYQTPYADRVRHEARIPTMTVGGISSYADVNSILVAGRADLCVLARAHLWDPYWTRHAAFEQGYDLRWPNQYRSLEGYQPRFK